MRVVVYHVSHGCDTGCCGHVVELDGKEHFEFTHPYDQPWREFVRELVTDTYGAEHVADIDWDSCQVVDD